MLRAPRTAHRGDPEATLPASCSCLICRLCIPPCHKAAHRPPWPGPSLSRCLPVTVSPSLIFCHHVCSDDSHSFPRQPRLRPESLLVTPHGSPRGPSALRGPGGAPELSPEARQAVGARTLLLPSSTSQTTVAAPTPPSLPHPGPKSSDCTVPRPTSPSSHTITPRQGFSLPRLPFSMPTLLAAVPEREA